MNGITITLPVNIVAAHARWLRKWKECNGMSPPAAYSMSIRQLTPAGPQDSRWHRSLDYRLPGTLTCRQILSRLAYWKRVHPCETFIVPLYDHTDLTVRQHAAKLEITPEEYCERCITYHASLTGGREFDETVFDRFERALARDFREEKAQRVQRAEACVEIGLTLVDFEPSIEVAA